MKFRRVIIESPFAGDIERNLRYLRAAMRDCLLRGESPYASHALYTQPGVLRDDIPNERKLGIDAGFAWRRSADATVIYEDLGYSRGMWLGLGQAIGMGHPVEFRRIDDWEPGYLPDVDGGQQ
jgi:hypothetical protein